VVTTAWAEISESLAEVGSDFDPSRSWISKLSPDRSHHTVLFPVGRSSLLSQLAAQTRLNPKLTMNRFSIPHPPIIVDDYE
jgi:hypothetical protein